MRKVNIFACQSARETGSPRCLVSWIVLTSWRHDKLHCLLIQLISYVLHTWGRLRTNHVLHGAFFFVTVGGFKCCCQMCLHNQNSEFINHTTNLLNLGC
jgi:hypothetical protein